ncbi:methyltransferase domain-containing protein [Actinoallomurus sp. NPDC050550]|uniref:class I SAM-dependent methyltransferase n=1 Tax=Actinoallomurus sp. NPDC050550 TaxID=3154937 RepID=UPI0033FD9732
MAAPHIELDSPDAIDGRHIRAVAFQKVRVEYVQRVLERHGGRALVVGSGRGDLAAALGGLGFDVTAVDPSPSATALARQRHGDRIVHETATAEDLGHEDGSFDLAYYADTFEITPDLDRVVGHAARVLRPGGVLMYDTVTRTLVSRLIYLGAFQGVPQTRIMPRGRYAAARLRPPAEVARVLERHGLHGEDVCGFKPTRPRDLVTAVLARRRGRITDDDIAEACPFVLDPDHRPVVTYLGYARKP